LYCVNRKQRIIYVGAKGTKERNKKRVPIYFELLSIFKGLKVRELNNQGVFAINGQPLGKDSTKKAWDRALTKCKQTAEKEEMLRCASKQ
jgi:hypothetical protein